LNDDKTEAEMIQSIVLNPEGKIQARIHGDFSRNLTAIMSLRPCDVTLDMKRVTALDSPGMALILQVSRSMTENGGSFRVIGLNDRLKGVFERSGIGVN
jgi:anti-anti-sigma factor